MKNNLWKPILPPFREHKKKVYSRIISVCDFIYQIGELEALRKSSKPVPSKIIKTKVFQAKLSYLKKCLLKYRQLTGMGRGISAVQVGIPERFSVIYTGTKNEPMVIINPKITKKSQKFLRYPEICMSASPLIAPVVRPAWIEFEYLNEKGERCFWETKANSKKGKIYNRVFQHEIDHMSGIINIDMAESRELTLESDPKDDDSAEFEKV